MLAHGYSWSHLESTKTNTDQVVIVQNIIPTISIDLINTCNTIWTTQTVAMERMQVNSINHSSHLDTQATLS